MPVFSLINVQVFCGIRTLSMRPQPSSAAGKQHWTGGLENLNFSNAAKNSSQTPIQLKKARTEGGAGTLLQLHSSIKHGRSAGYESQHQL